MPADLEHVAETGRHQHAGARALPFQDRIGRNGRAVKHGGDSGRRCAGKPQIFSTPSKKPSDGPSASTEFWRSIGHPTSIDHDDVRERAADVERR